MPPKEKCAGWKTAEYNENSNAFLDNIVYTCPGSANEPGKFDKKGKPVKRNKTNYTGMLHSLTCREGSKKDLLKCVFPLFPKGNDAPDLFVDLFMGSGVVALNYIRGMDVPVDGKAWDGSKSAKKVKIKAKDGCEVWTNDLASIIPLTHKALQDIPDGQKDAFIEEAVELSKKVDYASGPKTRNNKETTLDLTHPRSSAYDTLDADELINKRATYLLHRADFGLTPKPSDGGLLAMLGTHSLRENKQAMDLDALNEAFGELGIDDEEDPDSDEEEARGGGPKKVKNEDEPSKASQVQDEHKLGPHLDYEDGYKDLVKWYHDGWKQFEKEYGDLTSEEKKAKKKEAKLRDKGVPVPPHCDRDCLNDNIDEFVYPALKKVGWLTPEQEANFKKYISWKGTPLETVTSTGKIKLIGKKGARIMDNGIIKKAYITPEGLLNVNAVTCGSMSSMGFGYIYKYTALDKKNIEEHMTYGKDIVYSTGDYTKVLERVKEYYRKNQDKNIFIFADPPYPEGQHYETKGGFTYGKAFDQVKFENDLFELHKETNGKVKILVTNGYKEWLNQYLKWRVLGGEDFWNVWQIVVGARGGKRLKPREELIYSNYKPVLPGEAKKEVPSVKHLKEDRKGVVDDFKKDKPDGRIKCMPKDEWKTLTDVIIKQLEE